jgi:hypothetical protein
MTNEVVVKDDSIRRIVPFEPMSYDDAVLTALKERAEARRAARQEKTPAGLGRVR